MAYHPQTLTAKLYWHVTQNPRTRTVKRRFMLHLGSDSNWRNPKPYTLNPKPSVCGCAEGLLDRLHLENVEFNAPHLTSEFRRKQARRKP